jgi:hypothetical protein
MACQNVAPTSGTRLLKRNDSAGRPCRDCNVNLHRVASFEPRASCVDWLTNSLCQPRLLPKGLKLGSQQWARRACKISRICFTSGGACSQRFRSLGSFEERKTLDAVLSSSRAPGRLCRGFFGACCSTRAVSRDPTGTWRWVPDITGHCPLLLRAGGLQFLSWRQLRGASRNLPRLCLSVLLSLHRLSQSSIDLRLLAIVIPRVSDG